MVYFYCHNSHLLSNYENNLKLLVKSKNLEQELQFNKINELWELEENNFKAKELVKILCPVCKEELDTIAPCECGGIYYAVYKDGKRSYSNCVAICNTWNCKNSLLTSAWAAIKHFSEKSFTII